MKWLRLHHDTITDPKWRLIADDSGQTEANVLAVWMHMMVNASASSERGTLEGWNDRIVASSLRIPVEAVAAIRQAMQGLVLDGDRLTGWDKRQFASDNVAERVKRHRSKAKENPPDGGSSNGSGGYRNGEEAHGNGDVTLQKQDETFPPLESVTSLPTPTLNKDDDENAGAREVALRVTELSGVEDKRGVATAQAWLTAGYDPQLDIYPVVPEVAAKAPEVIGSFRYFTGSIDRHHAARTSPQQEASNVHHFPSAKQQHRGSAGCAKGSVAATRVLTRILAKGD